MAHPYWPLFDLVVRTPRIELRPPDDDLCTELAALPDGGLFANGENQFLRDWWSTPSPERQRASLKWWWGNRASWSPDKWRLELAVLVDGRPVGVQGIGAEHFPVLRTVSTGSWLGLAHQGKGIGKEMRTAALHLAFAGLGAEEAHSEAFETNPNSIGVSDSLGYERDGHCLGLRGGERTRRIRFRMSKERYAELHRDDITIEGLEPCLEMFGLGPDLSPLG